MAYQNIGTPQIYLNIPEWMDSTGLHTISNSYRTLPVGTNTDTTLGFIYDYETAGGLVTLQNKFIAILGHSSNKIWVNNTYTTPIINGELDGSTVLLPGFSIARLNGQPADIYIGETGGEPFGSILLGHIFEFPHSPDLNLTLSYEYDGQKEITTRGGSTLTNSYYDGVPTWGNGLGAWELGGSNYYAKSGRRTWSLTFSFLSDENVFPDYASLTDTEGEHSNSSLLHDDTIQRVIHLTRGSRLPFLFQPDKENLVFAICKFDQQSFSFQQQAPNLYSCKLRIKEVW